MTRPNLFPANHSHLCNRGHLCPEAIVAHDGRWFITSGHCGFNSTANNASGYATEAAARKAIANQERPAFRAQIDGDG